MFHSCAAFCRLAQGFFYIPDMCAAKQSVEKTNNVVITIVEGCATVKEIAQEFNAIFAKEPGKKKWRCTARSIGPAQFVMRFPNASEVERACCYGKRMPLKEGTIVVCITPWTASIGAKGIMEKAWVRNIPPSCPPRCIRRIGAHSTSRTPCPSCFFWRLKRVASP